MGNAGTDDDHDPAPRALGPQPCARLDPDRRDRRPDDRAALGRPALREPTPTGHSKEPSPPRATSPSCRRSSTRSTPGRSRLDRARGLWRTCARSGPPPTPQACARYSCRRRAGHEGRLRVASSSAARTRMRSSSVIWCQRVPRRCPVLRTLPAASNSRSSPSTWSRFPFALSASSDVLSPPFRDSSDST